MRMAINVRVSDFLGVALRGIDDAQMLVLVHRDPSLTIPLGVSSDRDEISAAWQIWSDIFALPQLTEDKAREPAPRRRRHNAIRARRPKFLVRRRGGGAARSRRMCIRANARSSPGIKSPSASTRTRRRQAGPHHRIGEQPGKQQQPGIAVGLEDPQAQRGIADLQPPDLPGEMRGERGKPEPRRQAGAGERTAPAPIKTTARA